MGWTEREYREASSLRRPAFARALNLPRVTLLLVLLHALSFPLVLMMRFGEGQSIAALLPLSASPSWSAVLLHPLATSRLLTAIFSVAAIWTLGPRVESCVGARRAIGLYLGGNFCAGLVYYLLARAEPATGLLPLDFPAGALLAWCVASWHALRFEYVGLLGRQVSFAQLLTWVFGITALIWLAQYRVGASAALLSVASVAVVTMAEARLACWRRRARPAVVLDRRPPSKSLDIRARDAALDLEIDRLLIKIRRGGGLDCLTQDERDRLERARQAKLQRPL